jgi:vancomycin permeability regulator SanA
VAIVLGAQVHEDGRPSRFLEARLALAERLYESGRVRALLVTGDHGRWAYDEPGTMRRWLVEHGVPERRVVVDHAGFDTYDSCLRARRIFGVRRAVVVTQTFHVLRGRCAGRWAWTPSGSATTRSAHCRTGGGGASRANRRRA